MSSYYIKRELVRKYFAPFGANLAYLSNEKVGSSSIRLALAECRFSPFNFCNKQPLADQFINDHYAFFANDLSALPSFYKTFSFTRNPYQRFLSFYLNKINRSTTVVIPPPIETTLSQYAKFGFHADMSLEEAVQCLVKIDYHALDNHLYPQYFHLTHNGNLQADYIGKFENIAEEWGILNKVFFISCALPCYNKTVRNKDYALSAEAKYLLYEYYKGDFLLFDYANELDNFNDLQNKSEPKIVFPINMDLINSIKTRIEQNRITFIELAEYYTQYPDKKKQDFIAHQKKLIEYLQTNAKQTDADIIESINSLKQQIVDLKNLINSPRLLGKLYLKRLLNKFSSAIPVMRLRRIV